MLPLVVRLSLLLLSLLATARARGSANLYTCYSCSYASLSGSHLFPSNTTCAKPDSRTRTIGCQHGCVLTVSPDLVSRDCLPQGGAVCRSTTKCKSCKSSRCNDDPVTFATCYSCSYRSDVDASDTTDCAQPNAQTPTVSCVGNCTSDIAYASYNTLVYRTCAKTCGDRKACNLCTGDKCNGDAVNITTCYKCLSETDKSCSAPLRGTTAIAKCSGQCMTTVTTSSMVGELISRECSTTCTAASTDLFGMKVTTSCCSEDYCNGCDGCNGSTGMPRPMPIAVTAAAVLIYLLA